LTMWETVCSAGGLTMTMELRR